MICIINICTTIAGTILLTIIHLKEIFVWLKSKPRDDDWSRWSGGVWGASGGSVSARGVEGLSV